MNPNLPRASHVLFIGNFGSKGRFYFFIAEGHCFTKQGVDSMDLAPEEITLGSRVYCVSRLCFDLGGSWPLSVFHAQNDCLKAEDEDPLIMKGRDLRMAILKGMSALVPPSGVRSVRVPMSMEEFWVLFDKATSVNQIRHHQRGKVVYTPKSGKAINQLEYGLVMQLSGVESGRAYSMVKQAKEKGGTLQINAGATQTLKQKVKRVDAHPEAHRLVVQKDYSCKQQVPLVRLTPTQVDDLQAKIGHFASRKEKGHTTPSYFLGNKVGTDQRIFEARYNRLKGFASIKFSYEFRPVN